MKKIYTTLIASLLLVTNYATDIYVNNSGQPGTYTTIAAAISAASSGDRIFISPYGVYTENLTVDKSITIASAVSGTNFNVLGSFAVTANAGMDVRIIGGIFSSTLYATTNTATQNNMTDIYVIDSKFSSINLNDNFVRAHILFCSDLGSVSIQNGDVIGCSINNMLYVYDGPNTVTGDTVKIIANEIYMSLRYYSDDNYFVIANNSIGINNEDDHSNITHTGGVQFTANSYNSSVNNLFLNNFVISNANSSTTGGVVLFNDPLLNLSNVLIKNNIVIHKYLINSSYSTNYYAAIRSLSSAANYPFTLYNLCVGYIYGTNETENSKFTDIDNSASAAHNFYDSLNNFLNNKGRCTDEDHCINKGIPSIDHYDIDMTINDRGTYGGPYSIDNYINNTNGKARIYELDIPFEIWSGQTPTVKAKGAHTK